MLMKSEPPTTIYLKNYRPPDFVITHSDLDITLGFETTIVHGCHKVVRKNAGANNLELHCELMEVQSIAVNGNQLDSSQFSQSDTRLTLYDVGHDVSENFTLDIVNTIDPSRNTALSGLYKSGDMLCSQCEAEGYRRITPGIDRPDSLAIYKVKLSADKLTFPVLLCNGNLVESGDDKNFHYTLWHDPFPKPTYLFAIVAGKLSCLEDHFETMSGRIVSLKFYTRDRDIEKCDHAMASLKNAMHWDEQVYGREYDLDLFNVVAVDDFNMGAMENKSLNVFNAKYVLADSKMATDDDFQNVEGVIGHEYFHNWSGNRVTGRDWFQLSLKEGFTVFRDQAFSTDMGGRGVKRIDDVNALRAHQFKEDASPMAHPVRPDSYQEINNFYTATVYEKGAEVVRMIHTLLGSERFRKGTDFYFEKFDGQAVTTDEFVGAMETVSDQDLTQFKRWYSQAGTPRVEVETHFDSDNACYEIKMRQTCPATPGHEYKQPFVIPIKTALFSAAGEKLLLNDDVDELTLILDKPEQSYKITGIDNPPIPSLLRGFSAPVEMNLPLSDDQLETLLTHDDDPFNRWEAAQKLFLKQLLGDITDIQESRPGRENVRLAQVFNAVLSVALNEKLTENSSAPREGGDTTPRTGDDCMDAGGRATQEAKADDRAFLAKLLALPNAAYISEQISPIDPVAIELSRKQLKIFLATSAKDKLLACYHQCQSMNTGKPDPNEMAARSLRDTCLDYLNTLDDHESQSLSLNQLKKSRCMTDSASAIAFIANSLRDDKQRLLDDFYQQWKEEPLVVDMWLRAQATFAHDSTLRTVKKLTEHPGFDFTNPNKVYALISGFTHGNPFCFHADDGSGYQFIMHWIEKLDPINPQVSARLVSALNGWNKYKSGIRDKMKKTLVEISSLPNLSNDVGEIVEKNLA